jgi:hypothetical protein
MLATDGEGRVNQNAQIVCYCPSLVGPTEVFSRLLCGGYSMTLTILDPLTGQTVTITVPSGKAR